jgi:hypothetical protein
VKFDKDVAIQIAMRSFDSASLARVVQYDPETKDALKRNMSSVAWDAIQFYLDDYGFIETPEEAFQRFAKENRVAEEAHKEIKNQDKKEIVIAGLDFVLLDGHLSNGMDSCIVGAKEYIKELTTPRWYSPEQYLELTGEKYPDTAPVWSTSKYAIIEKPTKYNRLHWWLGVYSEARDNEVILCAYNHLGPPPRDWRPGKEADCDEGN